ncbi:MAG: glycosyltransferase [Pseudomonadota bacterium]
MSSLPEFLSPTSSAPLTLHITHAWGGGVARWIADQCRYDRGGRHLILSAAGRQDGCEHGQRLRLFSGLESATPMAEWTLTPPIADTIDHHPHYADLLDQIVQRYGVGRVVVSSLIGHSFDALRTGCTTLGVLHDFYPLSPILHEDPLDALDDQGQLDLTSALARQKAPLLFEHDQARYWESLGKAWADAVVEQQVQLLAPTRHVADRWQRLCGNRLPEIAVRPHGFTPPERWPDALPVTAPDQGPLRLAVVGRISVGKGLGLLKSALDALHPMARITLLGAGREAHSLFGRAGVDVVLDYDAEHLPELLATVNPHAVLFLSTVPETWNYVLSEIRALGLTPMATRLGSFAERIEHGVDGVLFDPEPAAFVATVKDWSERRDHLVRLGRAAGQAPKVAQAAAAYRALCGEADEAAAWSPIIPQFSVQAGVLSEQLRASRLKARQQTALIDKMQDDIEQRTDWARRSERLASERTTWARSLEATLSEEREKYGQLEQASRAQQRSIDRLDIALKASHSELVQRDQRLAEREHELAVAADAQRAVEQHIALMSRSLSWRLTRPLRFGARLIRAMLKMGLWNPLRWLSLSAKLLRSWRRDGGRGLLHGLYEQPPEAVGESIEEAVSEAIQTEPVRLLPVSIDAVDQPQASIIIPVYNKVELTSACLNSLVERAGATRFEVIVVDDCSSDGTEDYLAKCGGLRVIRNEQNAGFIDSCNRGAAAARGEQLVFLNNDTTVTEGWLEALLEPLNDDPSAGIVGARLVYPDGRLQEAGGIIFNDASGWNYGKGASPDEPQYGFVSEADYVSGACLAIRRKDFENLGGFDTRFRPAYYEDTDLCFQMREAGKRVLVQPACTIVHHEGGTSGTDESSGAKRHQVINRERFAEKWVEVLASHPAPEPDSERTDPVRHLRYRRFAKRALILDATTPQPDHDSGSVRIRAVMDLLLARGYQVSFMAENRQYVQGYTDQLTQAGIEVLHAPAVSELEPWLAEHGRDLDLVFASRHYVLSPQLSRLRHNAPDATLVFDTVDLHYLREQREAELTGDAVQVEQAAATREQELRLIAQADVSLVVSPVEQTLLESEVPSADIRVLSNIHRVHGRGPSWSERRGLLFVGGFQHVPNIDSVRWLAAEIFPRIREALPDIELHLVGSRMPDDIRALGEQDGIVVHGFVEDLDPMLASARISLAPLRYGAGVKGKVNQAMSHGLPVVATPCAAEGMYLVHEQDVLVAESAEDFADQVLRLYEDEALWNRLADGGLTNVETHFSRRAAEAVLAGLESD